MSEPKVSVASGAVTSTMTRPERPARFPADGPVTAAPSTSGSSALRREILLRLRRSGPTSPDLLAAGIGASRTGVLQQLRALEAAGLVRRETVRHGVGRPRHVYDVTEGAQAFFPANYDGLASGLLAAVRAVGGDALVEEVFDERRRATAEQMRRRIDERLDPDAPLLDRVRELAVIQDEQGYLAEAILGADGVIRIVEHNCAIHRVATDQAAACQAELELFREVLGADVERESHIARGDRCCTYLVRD